jgi:hypothetical protein
VIINDVSDYICNHPVFGPNREDVTGNWRKRHSELYNFHFLLIIMVIKLRRMLAVHVAYMREIKNAYKDIDGKTEETLWEI